MILSYVIILASIIIFSILILLIRGASRNLPIEPEQITAQPVQIQQMKKSLIKCTETTNYCFNDNDCLTTCVKGSAFVCREGICKNTQVINLIHSTECDPKAGFMTYLVRKPTIGTCVKVLTKLLLELVKII